MKATPQDSPETTPARPGSPSQTLANLVGHSLSVPGKTSLADAHKAFHGHVYKFMAVEENGRITGLCSREKIGDLLGSQFGYSIYAKKAVRDFLLPQPEIVQPETPLRELLGRVFSRPGERFYHDVVLIDSRQHLLGLIPVDALVRLQNRMLSEKITELEESEHSLIRKKAQLTDLTARLEEANTELASARDSAVEGTRLKSQFLANMSHEIRTPMNGIIGMISLLADSPLSDEQHYHCNTIRKSADTLLRLIDDILDFSKIEAGRLDICPEDTPIRELLEDCLALLAESVPHKPLELLIDIDPAVPEWVTLDPLRYRQILTNLVGNALKFTESGEVTVSLRLLHQPEKGHFLQTEVKDTGIGIAAEQQQKLFEPFVQADGSTSRRYGGTGLGLAISRRLASLMEGSLSCASEIGQGSTFWLTLPLQTAPSPAPRQRSFPTGLRALVVESHPTATDLMMRQIAAHGVLCAAAGSIAQAQHLWREALQADEPYHWVFLDSRLPDALTLGQALAEQPAPKQPLLVLVHPAGRGGQHTESPPPAACPHRILTKPLGPVSLADLLHKTLPESPEPTRQDKAAVSPATPLPTQAPMRILLVEDNPTNQEVALRLLNRLGHETLIAENGLQALEILRDQTLDCILMDCQMPRMDGYETTRAIRQGFHGISQTSIPIIAMTAHAMQGDRQRCLQAGMDDYLSKPVSLEQLGATLQRLPQQATA